MALLDDVATLLDAAAIVPVDELVVGRLGDDVDTAVQVRDYGGRPPDQTHTGYAYRFPRVQVIVRDPDPEVARSRAQAIWALLDGTKRWTIAQLTVNGTEYQVVVPLNEPHPIAHDIARRTTIACDYEVRVPHA
jgi:hypothetical protein